MRIGCVAADDPESEGVTGNAASAGGASARTQLARPSSSTSSRMSGRTRVTLSTSTSPRSSRSEEHTSELQSLMRTSYAVLRLKQKIKSNDHKMHTAETQKIDCMR